MHTTSNRPLIIRGGTVLAANSASHGVNPIESDLLVIDGVIREIGVINYRDDAKVFDARGTIVSPGFVDTHRHTWETAFRGLGADWSLAQYGRAMHMTAKPCMDPDDTYIANLAGRIEALRNGITTMVDWCHGATTPAHGDAALAGLLESPGRSVFGYADSWRLFEPETGPRDFARLLDVHRSASTDLVSVAYAIRGAQYTTIEDTIDEVAVARDLDVPVTVHAGSGSWGRLRGLEQMYKAGLLDDRTTVVHVTTVADDEIQMLANAGSHVSVSPVAEIQMGYGWSATLRLLDAGVRPSYSIDDCNAVGGDMFRTMTADLITHRGATKVGRTDATEDAQQPLNSSDVFDFATNQGGRAVSHDLPIGRIATGYAADLLIIDASDPSIYPVNEPVRTIVSAGHPGIIRDIFVNGELVMQDRQLVGVNLEAVQSHLIKSRDAIVRRARSRGLGDAQVDGTWDPPVAGLTLTNEPRS